MKKQGNNKIGIKFIACIIIGLFIIGGAVTGCKSKSTNDEGKTQNNDNNTNTNDVKLPANFPQNIPVYKTGTLTDVFELDFSTGYELTTNDEVTNIARWFDTELTNAGWTVSGDGIDDLVRAIGETGVMGFVMYFDNATHTGVVQARDNSPQDGIFVSVSVTEK